MPLILTVLKSLDPSLEVVLQSVRVVDAGKLNEEYLDALVVVALAVGRRRVARDGRVDRRELDRLRAHAPRRHLRKQPRVEHNAQRALGAHDYPRRLLVLAVALAVRPVVEVQLAAPALVPVLLDAVEDEELAGELENVALGLLARRDDDGVRREEADALLLLGRAAALVLLGALLEALAGGRRSLGGRRCSPFLSPGGELAAFELWFSLTGVALTAAANKFSDPEEKSNSLSSLGPSFSYSFTAIIFDSF